MDVLKCPFTEGACPHNLLSLFPDTREIRETLVGGPDVVQIGQTLVDFEEATSPCGTPIFDVGERVPVEPGQSVVMHVGPTAMHPCVDFHPCGK